MNIQTKFKLYQINRMEQELNNHFPSHGSKIELQKFVMNRESLIASLKYNGRNHLENDNQQPLIKESNDRLIELLTKEIEEAKIKIKEQKLVSEGEKKFFGDAINATVASLLNDKIYPKTNIVHLIIDRDSLKENIGHRVADLEVYLKDRVADTLAQSLSDNGNRFDSSVFELNSYNEDPREFIVNVSFPSCEPVQDAIFKGLKDVRNDFNGTINVMGMNDLNETLDENETYIRALSASNKSLSEGLFVRRSSDLSSQYKDIVEDSGKFEKIYEKWKITAMENKEQFDFGMIK